VSELIVACWVPLGCVGLGTASEEAYARVINRWGRMLHKLLQKSLQNYQGWGHVGVVLVN
jgi:hypothetical protein